MPGSIPGVGTTRVWQNGECANLLNWFVGVRFLLLAYGFVAQQARAIGSYPIGWRFDPSQIHNALMAEWRCTRLLIWQRGFNSYWAHMGESYNGITLLLQSSHQSSILCSSTISNSFNGRTSGSDPDNVGSNPALLAIGGSSNGRMADFDSVHVGSNPALPATSV